MMVTMSGWGGEFGMTGMNFKFKQIDRHEFQYAHYGF